jgi:hypothetical protein
MVKTILLHYSVAVKKNIALLASSNKNCWYYLLLNLFVFFLWRFVPYSGYGFPLCGFAITLISDTPRSVGIPGQVIRPTQKPLPDNTQRSQETVPNLLNGSSI